MISKFVGKYIYLITFVFVICLPWFLWLFLGKYVDSDNYENRNLAERPVFDIDSFADYPVNYEAYYNDNLPFRGLLISANTKIDYFIFHKSSSTQVTIGKDGWLFYNDTLRDYKKDNLYSQEQLEEIKNNLLATKNFFEEQGIEFILYIAPNKSSIYGAYMPSYIEQNEGTSRMEQVVEYLRENTDVMIIFPEEDLRKVVEENPEISLYLKLDTHWNYMGGFFGVQPLLEALGVETTVFENISYEEVNEPDFFWNGYDLANMLGLSDVLDTDTNYRIAGYSENTVTYDGNVQNDKNAFSTFVRTYSDSSDTRKVFFARDSFGEAMTPFLAAEFGEIYSVHRSYMTKTQIFEEAPDIFIYEMVERGSFDGLAIQNWVE